MGGLLVVKVKEIPVPVAAAVPDDKAQVELIARSDRVLWVRDITSVAPAAFATGQQTAGAAALALGPSSGPYDGGILLTNTGAVTVFVGSSAAVTIATGYPLLPGASVVVSNDPSLVFVVTAAAAAVVGWVAS